MLHLEFLVFIPAGFTASETLTMILRQFGTPVAPNVSPYVTRFYVRRAGVGGVNFELRIENPTGTSSTTLFTSLGAGSYFMRIGYSRALSAATSNPQLVVSTMTGTRQISTPALGTWLTATDSVSFETEPGVLLDEILYAAGTNPLTSGICAYIDT